MPDLENEYQEYFDSNHNTTDKTDSINIFNFVCTSYLMPTTLSFKAKLYYSPSNVDKFRISISSYDSCEIESFREIWTNYTATFIISLLGEVTNKKFQENSNNLQHFYPSIQLPKIPNFMYGNHYNYPKYNLIEMASYGWGREFDEYNNKVYRIQIKVDALKYLQEIDMSERYEDMSFYTKRRFEYITKNLIIVFNDKDGNYLVDTCYPILEIAKQKQIETLNTFLISDKPINGNQIIKFEKIDVSNLPDLIALYRFFNYVSPPTQEHTISLNKSKIKKEKIKVSEDVIRRVNKKLMNDDLDSAIDLIFDISVNQDMEKELITQLGRLNKLKSDIRKGIISWDNQQVEHNKIRNSIIEIKNLLE